MAISPSLQPGPNQVLENPQHFVVTIALVAETDAAAAAVAAELGRRLTETAKPACGAWFR